MAVITVTIKDGNPPTVDKSPVKISKVGLDRVKWTTNPPGQAFVVAFKNETPFDPWYFYPSNDRSAKIKVEPDSTKKYSYTVMINGHSVDSDIIIEQ